MILSNDPNLIHQIDSITITDDMAGNHWLTLNGHVSSLSYQIYQISRVTDVPFIDMNSAFPFPDQYPDSVQLYLQAGQNIESNHPILIALADSLTGGTTDMAIAAQNIATSEYISHMPYD